MYRGEFDVSGKEVQPRGVCFKPDGTKMYIVGLAGKSVDEYDLGTQWDVTSAVYLREFDVSAKEDAPQGLYIKPDGTKLYIIGSDGDMVDEYDLGTQWNVTTAVYLQEFSVAAEDLTPLDVFFKPDGTKMYVVGWVGVSVYEYDLGTQWDVATAVYLREISVAVKEAELRSACLKPDGTKLYTVGSDGDTVDEYDLGTPWDVTSAVYLREFSVVARDLIPVGVTLKPDGTKLYTVGDDGNSVDEYDL